MLPILKSFLKAATLAILKANVHPAMVSGISFLWVPTGRKSINVPRPILAPMGPSSIYAFYRLP